MGVVDDARLKPLSNGGDLSSTIHGMTQELFNIHAAVLILSLLLDESRIGLYRSAIAPNEHVEHGPFLGLFLQRPLRGRVPGTNARPSLLWHTVRLDRVHGPACYL